MKRIQRTLNIVLALVFLGTVSFNGQLSASYGSTIKADEIITLGVTTEMPHDVEVIAWTYDREIYLLDEDLSLIKKIKIPEASLSNIIQVPGSLYMLAAASTKTGETESILIQYDIAQGKEKNVGRILSITYGHFQQLIKQRLQCPQKGFCLNWEQTILRR